MAYSATTYLLQALPFLLLSIITTANGSDADILTDFIVPPSLNASAMKGDFFTFTGMRGVLHGPFPNTFTFHRVFMDEFPALNGQGVSYIFLLFPPGTVNPLHSHPRASELVFVAKGQIQVGFVDSTNKLYSQILQPGDVFLIPQGLVHFQYCISKEPAVVMVAFDSANPGVLPVPFNVFTSGIDDVVLAKSFNTGVRTIRKIKAGLHFKA